MSSRASWPICVGASTKLQQHYSLGVRFVDVPGCCPSSLKVKLMESLRLGAALPVTLQNGVLCVNEYVRSAHSFHFAVDETSEDNISAWTPLMQWKRPTILLTAGHRAQLEDPEVRAEVQKKLAARAEKLIPLVRVIVVLGCASNEPTPWMTTDFFPFATLETMTNDTSKLLAFFAEQCTSVVTARLRGISLAQTDSVDNDPHYLLPWESAQRGNRTPDQLAFRVAKRRADLLMSICAIRSALIEFKDLPPLLGNQSPQEDYWLAASLELLAAARFHDAITLTARLQRRGALDYSELESDLAAFDARRLDVPAPILANALGAKLEPVDVKLLRQTVMAAKNDASAANREAVNLHSGELCWRLFEEIDSMLKSAQAIYFTGMKRNEMLRELDVELRLKRLAALVDLCSESFSGDKNFVVTLNHCVQDVQECAMRLSNQVRVMICTHIAATFRSCGLRRRALFLQYQALTMLKDEPIVTSGDKDRLLSVASTLLRHAGVRFTIDAPRGVLRRLEFSDEAHSSRRIHALVVFMCLVVTKGTSTMPTFPVLRCQLATLLATTYSDYLRSEAVKSTLDSLLVASNDLPAGVPAFAESLPLIASVIPRRIHKGLEPASIEITKIFVTGAPNTWLIVHGVCVAQGPIWVQGALAQIEIVIRNPLPYGLLFDGCRCNARWSSPEQAGGGSDLGIGRNDALMRASTPMTAQFSVPPKGCTQIVVSIVPSECGWLCIHELELFVACRPRLDIPNLVLSSTADSMRIAIPHPLTLPVVQAAGTLDGQFDQPLVKTLCQASPFRSGLRLINVGNTTIDSVTVSTHFSYCATATCPGCSGRRGQGEEHLAVVRVNAKESTSGRSRTSLLGTGDHLIQGQSILVPFTVFPPARLPRCQATYVTFRVRYGDCVPNDFSRNVPLSPAVLPHDTVLAVVPQREVEFSLVIDCEPGPSIRMVALSPDRRFIDIRIANDNSREGLSMVFKSAMKFRPCMSDDDAIVTTETVDSVPVCLTSTWSDALTCPPSQEAILRASLADLTFEALSRKGRRAVRQLPITWSTNSEIPFLKAQGMLLVDIASVLPESGLTEVFSPETLLCAATMHTNDASDDSTIRWFSFAPQLTRFPILCATGSSLTVNASLSAPSWIGCLDVEVQVSVEPHSQSMLFGNLVTQRTIGHSGSSAMEIRVELLLCFPGDFTLMFVATDVKAGRVLSFQIPLSAEHRSHSIR